MQEEVIEITTKSGSIRLSALRLLDPDRAMLIDIRDVLREDQRRKGKARAGRFVRVAR